MTMTHTTHLEPLGTRKRRIKNPSALTSPLAIVPPQKNAMPTAEKRAAK